MQKTESEIKKLRAQHEAIMQKDNSLLNPEAVAVRKQIIRLTSIKEPHCQSCGSIIGKECGQWDGYTSCCNELIISGGCSSHDCYHLV